MKPTFQFCAYRIAIGFAIAFSLLHLLSLPVAVSYDGFIYIDMASVLGSSRFPQDWSSARTPLFPLILKFSFWLMGRQPHAVIAVSTAFAMSGTLLLGMALRRIIGDYGAAAAVVLLTIFPLSVSYQHYALTEAGTAFFMIALAALLLWQPRGPKQDWVKVIGLIAVCSSGYYWRQAIMSLAPIVALFYAVGSGTQKGENAYQTKSRAGHWGALLPRATRIALIAILPFLFAKAWSPYFDERGMRDTMLRQGILRQALIPADHPYMRPHAEAYRKAVQESVYHGAYYSGIRADLLGVISEQLYSKPIDEPVSSFFRDLILENPGRYFSAVGRTLVLYFGVRALQNENLIMQEIILSPTLSGNRVGDAPSNLTQITEDLQQKTKPCFVQNVLWTLAPVYGYLLIAANLVTVLGMLSGLLLRNKALLVLCALPLMYMVNCAAVLASIDRYAFPAYPIVVANLIAVPLLVGRAIAGRLQTRRRPPLA